jgi:hypothetical protein
LKTGSEYVKIQLITDLGRHDHHDHRKWLVSWVTIVSILVRRLMEGEGAPWPQQPTGY